MTVTSTRPSLPSLPELTGLVAEVLTAAPEAVGDAAASKSFVGLGGNSLAAMELAALAERRLGLRLDPTSLLGAAPLAEVLAAVEPATREPGEEAAVAGLRPTLPGQDGMLLTEQFIGGTALHFVFSAEIRGPLDEDVLVTVLKHLAWRHEGLRTTFVAGAGQFRRRVLEHWEPRLVRQALRAAEGDDPVTLVHDQLARTSGRFLQPASRPPYAFVLTRFPDRHVLSLVVHHVLADGWAVGLLWRELFDGYRALRAGETLPGRAPTADAVFARDADGLSTDVEERTKRRIERLSGYPTVLELPSDLTRPPSFDFAGQRWNFGLGDEARLACERLAAEHGVTRNTVLVAAWALVLGRRAGTDRFLLGLASGRRTDAGAMRTFASLAALAPMRCDLPASGSVGDYLRATAGSVYEAVDASDIAFEALVGGLGGMADERRVPLVQAVFGAEDELIPDTLSIVDLAVTFREAHCGGTSADVSLYVQRWGTRPRLALEYGTSVLTAAEAADLADAFEATLIEFAAGPASLSEVSGTSPEQRERLRSYGEGREWRAEDGLWQVIEARADAHPDDVAVHDGAAGVTLTYRQLLEAATAQSAALAAAGAGPGGHVVIAVPRGVSELVGVLAAVRLGAAYAALNPANPPTRVREILDLLKPDALLATDEELAKRSITPLEGCAVVAPIAPSTPPPPGAPAPAAADPERVCYVAFTSGSTGRPKAVRVPQRGVLRLAADDHLRVGPGERVLRYAPLFFDISTQEIFAPLVRGGTIEIYPDVPPVVAELADFLVEREITVMVIAAGVFRLLAEYRPEAFAGLRQVVAGGDIVPAPQVRALLETHPGLRITNAYGPTECTTWATVAHFDDVCEVTDPLPVGRPITGTGILVLDERGEPVPPGAVGEICLHGAGLALDYLGDEEQTRTAFGRRSPRGGPMYRTGDYGRWNGSGELTFLGRRDRQVKIRGFRIELDEIVSRLGAHAAVRDAVVVPVGPEPTSRRLLAAVVADEREGLAEELREFVAAGVPRYAVPDLWVVIDRIPLTSVGKTDVGELENLAGVRRLGSDNGES